MKLVVIFILIISTSLIACRPAYVVRERPSEVIYTRPAPPPGEYIWIGGNWVWRSGRYVWQEGHWERRRAGVVWMDGHWKRTNRGWIWDPGHWRRA